LGHAWLVNQRRAATVQNKNRSVKEEAFEETQGGREPSEREARFEREKPRGGLTKRVKAALVE